MVMFKLYQSRDAILFNISQLNHDLVAPNMSNVLLAGTYSVSI
jgi:hypothetical protein